VTVDVLLALEASDREARLVGALAAGSSPLRVVRRCVDLADLLAAAAAGLGRAAVVSAGLPRLDRDALSRLAVAGVAVVAVVDPDDEPAERRIRQLGLHRVIGGGATADELARAVLAALSDPPMTSRDFGAPPEPAAALPGTGLAPVVGQGGDPGAFGDDPGRVVTVWGPSGAPGRSTVAVNLAAELAERAGSALLIDADTYAASVAQLLGVLDESPGVAAACRLALAGRLDVAALTDLTVAVGPGLVVLTGLPRPQRWPEVRASGLTAVLEVARRMAPVVVVDVAAFLEQDEDLSYDTAAPHRNAATLAAVDAADTVLVVGAADPVGLQRFVRGVAELREACPSAELRPVINQMRSGAIPGDPQREITTVLERFSALRSPTFLPEDRAACDAALAAGRVLAEVAARSPLRRALGVLAEDLVGRSTGGRGQRQRARYLPSSWRATDRR
jgi:MinD-like ATPase involved in chromosome partitioning or flagellar assembly